ncbi:Endoribonuclease L-PSP [Gloeothece citriformis PCC 7424]|uniref:Endoribonuclease L-PSP n=1 Tax=Gloeothece citriformis (strain PCC 7424) TaxID=65393 RepID=B7KBV0_GLOC7|nr:Rid family hydrolase [Gloeothece citriformis]ACK73078.1 Endoribonuclease L-PSP [Gloeothece citriformis PCC 7424]
MKRWLLAIVVLALVLLTDLSLAQAEEFKRLNPKELVDLSQYYTQIIEVPSNTRLIYIAGQSGTDATGKIVSDDTADQMRQSFHNLRIALDQVGAKPEDVAKITVLIVNHNEELLKPLEEEINKLWGSKTPTSTLIPVPRLALDEMKFEIDAIAVVPNS